MCRWMGFQDVTKHAPILLISSRVCHICQWTGDKVSTEQNKCEVFRIGDDSWNCFIRPADHCIQSNALNGCDKSLLSHCLQPMFPEGDFKASSPAITESRTIIIWFKRIIPQAAPTSSSCSTRTCFSESSVSSGTRWNHNLSAGFLKPLINLHPKSTSCPDDILHSWFLQPIPTK